MKNIGSLPIPREIPPTNSREFLNIGNVKSTGVNVNPTGRVAGLPTIDHIPNHPYPYTQPYPHPHSHSHSQPYLEQRNHQQRLLSTSTAMNHHRSFPTYFRRNVSFNDENDGIYSGPGYYEGNRGGGIPGVPFPGHTQGPGPYPPDYRIPPGNEYEYEYEYPPVARDYPYRVIPGSGRGSEGRFNQEYGEYGGGSYPVRGGEYNSTNEYYNNNVSQRRGSDQSGMTTASTRSSREGSSNDLLVSGLNGLNKQFLDTQNVPSRNASFTYGKYSVRVGDISNSKYDNNEYYNNSMNQRKGSDQSALTTLTSGTAAWKYGSTDSLDSENESVHSVHYETDRILNPRVNFKMEPIGVGVGVGRGIGMGGVSQEVDHSYIVNDYSVNDFGVQSNPYSNTTNRSIQLRNRLPNQRYEDINYRGIDSSLISSEVYSAPI